MATNFPTSLDNLTNPLPTDSQAVVSHADQHANANDAIEAIEAKVGINGSTNQNSHDYKLSGVTGSDKAVSRTGTETLSGKTLTGPIVNGGTIDNATITNPTFSSPLPVAQGGTGSTTANGGLNNLLPSQTGNNGKALVTDGTNTSWNTVAQPKFGGTGADGALSISSGTTNIDLGGAKYYVKNYTSISITGTANVTFSNPHTNGTIVVFKSQGNVTITSSATDSINLVGIGAQGVTAGAVGLIGNSTVVRPTAANPGANTSSAQTGGKGVYIGELGPVGKSVALYCGSSGGGPQPGGNGTSGRGGGCLYIECGGDWNVTGNINVGGQNAVGNSNSPGGNINYSGGGGGASHDDGSNGTGGGPGNAYGGPGGGGGGVFVGLYNGALIANTGTYTITGGAGGAYSGTGGNGYSFVGKNTEFL